MCVSMERMDRPHPPFRLLLFLLLRFPKRDRAAIFSLAMLPRARHPQQRMDLIDPRFLFPPPSPLPRHPNHLQALAASSRPRVSTPPSSRSPSRDRSSGGGGGGGGGGNNGHRINTPSPQPASSSLGVMATAVEALAPGAPLGQAGGGARVGGSPAGASANSNTTGLP